MGRCCYFQAALSLFLARGSPAISTVAHTTTPTSGPRLRIPAANSNV